jgi:hypothetical protein
MPTHFTESFSFNEGDLGRNLATLDDRIHRFIKADLDVAAGRGETIMKTTHPWRNRTGNAEAGLWADAEDDGRGRYQLYMGHGVEYGIYLEKSNGGRFQIVMPTLVETARAFMESLTQMLEHLDSPGVVEVASPGVGFERGTSQGAIEHGQHVRGAAEKAFKKVNKLKLYFRDAKGRFISTKTTAKTAVTKRTRRR